ncbi:pentapeptide repeat-containing protein [Polyangium fumosum]|uniref:NACHT domain-containing protein n=1 Tax=Polyangium fumosum TaxID=889272 RepID=A0A4V5PNR5_9BACT|nr:pentapeptide repeat-containing protein [Polyangium fumosum]TKC92130.1 hypothetical protein E8A74_50315 [Polyangium fumosum]
MADLSTAISILANLIEFGLKASSAKESSGIDEKDIEALKAFLETGGVFASLRGRQSATPDVAARQLGLVTKAFGMAFGRHWQHNELAAPQKGRKLFPSGSERERRDEIEARTRSAVLRLEALGDHHDLSKDEIQRVDALTGSPLNTPYFCALWDAFSEPDSIRLGSPPDELPVLFLSNTTRRQFERHFLLAYWEALASPAGEGVRDYIEKDLRSYRRLLVREMLLGDLASWGDRHVFGNIERHRRDPSDPLPFLPLREMYVEPYATAEDCGRPIGTPRPILEQIYALLTQQQPNVFVVKANFGSGKSLTARTLAMQLANAYLNTSGASTDAWLPIYIRCADDFSGGGLDIEQTVRRALKRQAASFDLSLKASDDALVLPEAEQRVVFLLDGLDEVALGERQLEAMFQALRDEATALQRFIVFSRPGALPRNLEKYGVELYELLPLQRPSRSSENEQTKWQPKEDQIALWLDRWNVLAGRPDPITPAQIARRGLAEAATTPILLLMIAETWDDHVRRQTPPSLAEIYEVFFWHIARGKHEADREHNNTVFDASERLLKKLQENGELGDEARPPDAMLWLMARVAWEAKKLDQQVPALPLRTRRVDNMIEEELGIEESEDVLRTIRVGLLLALQADLESKSDHILFGHQSFREFLVARHWSDRLRRIVRLPHRQRSGYEGALLGGRLLGDEDKSFDFLRSMVNAECDPQRPASPVGWSEVDRRELQVWCQEKFENDDQDFGKSKSRAIWADQRAAFREAILAIGSSIKGVPELVDQTGAGLRSILAWFWMTGKGPIVIAPRAKLHDSQLGAARLTRVDLQKTELVGANLSDAMISGGEMDGIDLSGSTMIGTRIVNCAMPEACMDRTHASSAMFYSCLMERVKMRVANLMGVRFVHVNLSGADLSGSDADWASFETAFLNGADLSNASLRYADLSEATLDGVKLLNARYNSKTKWPSDFDPEAHGAVQVVEDDEEDKG